MDERIKSITLEIVPLLLRDYLGYLDKRIEEKEKQSFILSITLSTYQSALMSSLNILFNDYAEMKKMCEELMFDINKFIFNRMEMRELYIMKNDKIIEKHEKSEKMQEDK